MLTQFFLTINEWMTGATWLAALGCFLWGMVSVLFSPCHLASIPLVVAYVAGQEKAAPAAAGRPLRHSFYRWSLHHDRRDRHRLRALGTDARGCRQLLADRRRARPDLGRPGNARRGEVQPLRQPAASAAMSRASAGPSSWGSPTGFSPAPAPSASSPRSWRSSRSSRRS